MQLDAKAQEIGKLVLLLNNTMKEQEALRQDISKACSSMSMDPFPWLGEQPLSPHSPFRPIQPYSAPLPTPHPPLLALPPPDKLRLMEPGTDYDRGVGGSLLSTLSGGKLKPGQHVSHFMDTSLPWDVSTTHGPLVLSTGVYTHVEVIHHALKSFARVNSPEVGTLDDVTSIDKKSIVCVLTDPRSWASMLGRIAQHPTGENASRLFKFSEWVVGLVPTDLTKGEHYVCMFLNTSSKICTVVDPLDPAGDNTQPPDHFVAWEEKADLGLTCVCGLKAFMHALFNDANMNDASLHCIQLQKGEPFRPSCAYWAMYILGIFTVVKAQKASLDTSAVMETLRKLEDIHQTKYFCAPWAQFYLMETVSEVAQEMEGSKGKPWESSSPSSTPATSGQQGEASKGKPGESSSPYSTIT